MGTHEPPADGRRSAVPPASACKTGLLAATAHQRCDDPVAASLDHRPAHRPSVFQEPEAQPRPPSRSSSKTDFTACGAAVKPRLMGPAAARAHEAAAAEEIEEANKSLSCVEDLDVLPTQTEPMIIAGAGDAEVDYELTDAGESWAKPNGLECLDTRTPALELPVLTFHARTVNHLSTQTMSARRPRHLVAAVVAHPLAVAGALALCDRFPATKCVHRRATKCVHRRATNCVHRRATRSYDRPPAGGCRQSHR